MDRIIDVLNRFKQLSGWKLIHHHTTTQELYLIRREIDMTRSAEVDRFLLTVYLPTRKNAQEEAQPTVGLSSVEIHPSMTDQEIDQKVSQAVFAAQFIHNPAFPLLTPQEDRPAALEQPHVDLVDASVLLGKEMVTDRKDTGGWLNSGEVFMHHTTTHIRNSEGIDVVGSRYHGYLEFIVTHPSDSEEVEVFQQMHFTGMPVSMLRNRVDESFYLAAQRAQARQTPSIGKIPVILGGQAVIECFDYYLAHASAQMAYEEMTTAKPGDCLQGKEKILGDRLHISLDPFLEYGSRTASFDNDGFPWKKTELIKDGVLLRYWGDNRYAHYMGSQPTGGLSNIVVSPGSLSIDEMRASPHVELVSFSSFEVEELTGDFAGEIRLGWYDDGTHRLPVTGGSLSGNMHEIQSEIFFSKELMRMEEYNGPSRILMKGLEV